MGAAATSPRPFEVESWAPAPAPVLHTAGALQQYPAGSVPEKTSPRHLHAPENSVCTTCADGRSIWRAQRAQDRGPKVLPLPPSSRCRTHCSPLPRGYQQIWEARGPSMAGTQSTAGVVAASSVGRLDGDWCSRTGCLRGLWRCKRMGAYSIRLRWMNSCDSTGRSTRSAWSRRCGRVPPVQTEGGNEKRYSKGVLGGRGCGSTFLSI